MSKVTRFTSRSMKPRLPRRDAIRASLPLQGKADVLNDVTWPPVDLPDVSVMDPCLAGVSWSSVGLSMPVQSINIFFATETGASEEVANALGQEAAARGLVVSVRNLAETDVADLSAVETAFFVCSTTGDGDPPYNAESFFLQLAATDAPTLHQMRYAVLALGDSTYPHFCAAGRRLDEQLGTLGATRLLPRVDCDIDYDEPAASWRADLLDMVSKQPAPSPSLSLGAGLEAVSRGKHRLLEAEVVESRVLTGEGSSKATRHIVLAFSDAAACYQPGDALGVVVENDPDVVAAILEAGKLVAQTPVSLKGEQLPLEQLLRVYCEITTLTPRFIEAWAALTGSATLMSLLADDAADARGAFMQAYHIVDLMRAQPVSALDPQRFVQMLRPLQPRLYSIASSLSATPGEVHLTIAPVTYDLHGEMRRGVATGQLCERMPVGARLQVYIHSNPHFRLPSAEVPIVMIGAGTGVAPYRGFLQERSVQPKCGPAWLFFGERNRATDFLYGPEFEAFRAANILTRLDTAFSRDGEEKKYVQHRMLEQAEELARWIRDGAHVYVCGDARHMAPDVHEALVRVVEQGHGLSRSVAEAYVSEMQREGRYHRDVY